MKKLLLIIASIVSINAHSQLQNKLQKLEIPQIDKYTSWENVFKKAQKIEVIELLTGHVEADRYAFLNQQNPNLSKVSDRKKPIPVYAYAIKIKKRHILIDAGFDSSFSSGTGYGNMNKMAQGFMKQFGIKMTQKEGQDLNVHLKNNKVKPSHVLMTHLHTDHTAGLPALDNKVEISIGEAENDSITQLLIKNHFEGKTNINQISFDQAINLPPFEKVVDIYGDATVFAISTPGHSAGHISYFINDKKNPVLIIGDAIMYKDAYEYNVEPFCYPHQLKRTTETLQKIKSFVKAHPDVIILFSHDD